MDPQRLNYHHLQYFWVVARQGSIAKACSILHLAQPTISSQLQKLEQQLGGALFVRAGRGLKLTDLGQTVLRYAEEIFSLGGELLDVAHGQPVDQPLRLSVGVSDVLPKLVVYRLLLPALRMTVPVRLDCREGHLDELLGHLAAFELDIVLSDSLAGPASRVKTYSHPLGDCGVTFFSTHQLAAHLMGAFPRCLDGAPMLLPAPHSQLRRGLDQWFDEHDLRPRVVGEFQDSALMKVFGQEGLGVFPGPTVMADAITAQYHVHAIGALDAVRERFYALSVERRLKHPAVVEILNAARTHLFPATSDG